MRQEGGTQSPTRRGGGVHYLPPSYASLLGDRERGQERDPKVCSFNTHCLTLEPWFYDGQVSQGTELQGESNAIFRKNNWKL